LAPGLLPLDLHSFTGDDIFLCGFHLLPSADCHLSGVVRSFVSVLTSPTLNLSLFHGLTVTYFFRAMSLDFSGANLAQALTGKYLSAPWYYAALFLQRISGSLPHFLLNAGA